MGESFENLGRHSLYYFMTRLNVESYMTGSLMSTFVQLLQTCVSTRKRNNDVQNKSFVSYMPEMPFAKI